LLSVIAAVWMAPKVMRRPAGPVRAGRSVGPGVVLAVVAALVYLNQVLFTVYVLRVHGGDASFVARYLPAGWFDLADGSAVIGWVAERFPAPELLAPTVLRVQAFLELPFVLLAFLTVLRWLDADLYRRVAGSVLVWLASASYTVAFCLIELELRTPYTADDVVVRIAAGIVTPWLVAALATRDDATGRAQDATGLLLLLVSVWALGRLVLVVYDTALLYNLGELAHRLPGAVTAVAVLVVARVLAARRPAAEAGPTVGAVASGLRWWLVLFLVPALPIRYGVTFGLPVIALAGAVLVTVAAAAYGLRGAPWRTLAVAVVAGLGIGYVVLRLVSYRYYEAAVLDGGVAGAGVVVLVCALRDRSRARAAGRLAGL
jgi:hypothetical protein